MRRNVGGRRSWEDRSPANKGRRTSVVELQSLDSFNILNELGVDSSPKPPDNSLESQVLDFDLVIF